MDNGMNDHRGLFANPYGEPYVDRGELKDPLFAIEHREPTAHVQVGIQMRVKADGPQFMPMRAHEDDAGLDMYVSERVVIKPGEFVDVPSGICVQLPRGTWGLIQGRSSTLRKRSLLVNPGVIDVGYRGPLFSGVWNLGRETQILEVGERVAQLIVIANITEMVRVREVDELDESERGANGFGSSGR